MQLSIQIFISIDNLELGKFFAVSCADKAKPAAKQGRKATDLMQIAGLLKAATRFFLVQRRHTKDNGLEGGTLMKKILAIVCGVILFFGMVGGVQAVPITVGESNPGWVGTAGGSPPDNVSAYDYNLLNDIITAWNGVYVPPESSLELLTDNSFDYVSGPSMTWAGNYQYLSVKYAGYVDLFYVDGLTSFDWTGSEIGAKQGFSHGRLWNGTSTPVPEPTTILLLGLGLVGLTGSLRKKFKP